MVGASMLITGCDEPPEWLTPLTPEENTLMTDYVDVAEMEQQTVAKLIIATDIPVFGLDGIESKEQVIADIQTVTDNLKFLHEDGRIYTYDDEVLRHHSDAVAYYHGVFRDNAPSDKSVHDYIGLNRNFDYYWGPDVLMHESGHNIFGGHSKEMVRVRDLREGGDLSITDEVWTQTIIETHDFPYFLGEYYDAVGRFLWGFDVRNEYWLEHTIAAVQSGEASPKEAREEFNRFFLTPERYPASGLHGSDEEELSTYGVDRDEFIEAFMTPSLDAYFKQQHDEFSQELEKAIRESSEASTEIKNQGLLRR